MGCLQPCRSARRLRPTSMFGATPRRTGPTWLLTIGAARTARLATTGLRGATPTLTRANLGLNRPLRATAIRPRTRPLLRRSRRAIAAPIARRLRSPAIPSTAAERGVDESEDHLHGRGCGCGCGSSVGACCFIGCCPRRRIELRGLPQQPEDWGLSLPSRRRV